MSYVGPYTESTILVQNNRCNTMPSSLPVIPDSLLYIIDKVEDFSIFRQIIKQADMDFKFNTENIHYTVFIPSDNYLTQKYDKCFLNNIDTGRAREILNNSMMNRIIDRRILQQSPIIDFPVINREKTLNFRTKNNETVINGYIEVLYWNIKAVNGIIHVVSDFL